jgi:hypothetical protein
MATTNDKKGFMCLSRYEFNRLKAKFEKTTADVLIFDLNIETLTEDVKIKIKSDFCCEFEVGGRNGI